LQVQAEVMALMPDDAGRQHALQQLQLGIQRATRLLEQLLALSRLDPLQGLPSAQPVDWQQVSRDALSDVTLPAAAKDTVLESHWQTSPEAVLPLSGDATLLTCYCAICWIMRCAIARRAAGSRCAGGGEVVVQDNGPGIEAQWLARVQERFFRPPGQEMPGSGLGLSIVERIASLHGLQFATEQPGRGWVARQPAPARVTLRQSVALSLAMPGFKVPGNAGRLAPAGTLQGVIARPDQAGFLLSQPVVQAGLPPRWWPASASTVHCTPLQPWRPHSS
jgi:two-component system sensor histidine kinase QseC